MWESATSCSRALFGVIVAPTIPSIQTDSSGDFPSLSSTLTKHIASSWPCMCVNARLEFSCVMEAVPACLPAWGLRGQSVEFDEGLHVQLFNVFMASCKSNLEVLTNNECMHHHVLHVGSDN